MNKFFSIFTICIFIAVSIVAQTTKFDKINTLRGKGRDQTIAVTNSDALKNLDAFIKSCIAKKAFPGCQVIAAKDGEVFYQKSFGSYTYNQNAQAITDTTMYDIASITKIVSGTLAVMKLYEEGKLKLNAYIKHYLPFVVGTDKENITVRQLLLHEGGLKSWVPFYKSTLDSVSGNLRTDLYRSKPDDIFSVPVCANLFIKYKYEETIWDEILNSTMMAKGKYVYSDLDFYFLEKIVEKLTGTTIDQYVYKHFYKPLELRFTMYNPWEKDLVKQCAPTENDNAFRMQWIQGYVHDPGAAMVGGVAAHAGVFSNAREIAIIMQMLLNGGTYKDVTYFKKETVKFFTAYQSKTSRRGYGFDKPEKTGSNGPTSELCSKSTFGHQGFTGTCTWADPETGIVFVFLSNRVSPSADNKLIQSLKVRNVVQSYLYEAVGIKK